MELESIILLLFALVLIVVGVLGLIDEHRRAHTPVVPKHDKPVLKPHEVMAIQKRQIDQADRSERYA